MSSSGVLRRAVFEDDPLVIDNAHYFEPPEEKDLASDLAEALQQEHPDAAPEVIEDAIQDAMEQLMEAPEDDEPLVLGEEGEDAGFGFEEPEPAPEAEVGEGADAPLEQPFEDEPLATPDVIDQPVVAFGAASDDALESAQREAERVLADADARAAEIEQAAYEKGYQEGLTAGSADGEQQASDMLKQVTAIVDQATELHDTMLHEAESEMVALCLEIARKIIQAELRTNPDVVKSVLAAAVKKVNGSPRVTIRVNPAQVEGVRGHWQSTFGPSYREKEWVIEGDAQVTPGGCILETKYGSIDAQIGTQFGEIQKTFALLLGTQS